MGKGWQRDRGHPRQCEPALVYLSYQPQVLAKYSSVSSNKGTMFVATVLSHRSWWRGFSQLPNCRVYICGSTAGPNWSFSPKLVTGLRITPQLGGLYPRQHGCSKLHRPNAKVWSRSVAGIYLLCYVYRTCKNHNVQGSRWFTLLLLQPEWVRDLF